MLLIQYDNMYWKADPQKFNELLRLSVAKQRSLIYILSHSREDLLKWAYEVVSKEVFKLKPQPKASTVINWVLTGRASFPTCKNPKCNNMIIEDIAAVKQYKRYCCRSCATSDPDVIDAHKKTCALKYNDPDFTNRQKAQQTTFQHFGVNWPVQSEEVKMKAKATIQEKFGVDTYMQSDDFKQKSIDTMQKKYDVDNIMKTSWMPERVKMTKKAKYGNERFNNREKYVTTMLERHSVDHNFKTDAHKQLMKDKHDEIEAKKKHTLMKNFGLTHPPSFKYIYDNNSFDSTPELAYYIWLKDNNISFKFQPDIGFEFSAGGKKHFYYPDFYLTDEKQFVEVKGDHFFEEHDSTMQMICPYDRSKDDEYEAKHQCMIQNNVHIMTSIEYCRYVEYADQRFGQKNSLNQFKKTSTHS